MAHTYSIDKTYPDGTNHTVDVLDNDLRNLKLAIAERMLVDHNWPISGNTYDADDVGQHIKITFADVSAAPSPPAGGGVLYLTLNDTDKYELFYNGAGTAGTKMLTVDGRINILPADLVGAGLADDSSIELDGSNKFSVKDVGITAAMVAAGVVPTRNYVKFHETASGDGTDGGTFTQDQWQVRVLTEAQDVDEDTSAATQGAIDGSGVITLQSGTWRFRIHCSAYRVGRNQARLYDVDGAAVVAYGTSAFAGYNVASMASDSFIEGQFTIAAENDYKVEHYCETTRADEGLGEGNDFGGTNVFASAVFEKVK